MGRPNKLREIQSSFSGDPLDQEVAQRIQAIATDSEVFSIFFEEFYGIIFATFYRRLEDYNQAEDETINLLLHLRTRIPHSIKGDLFQHWVMRCVRNRAFNALRKQKRRRDHEVSWDRVVGGLADHQALDPEQAYEDSENLRFLEQILGDLTDEEKNLLFLDFYEVLTNKEIAYRIGKTEGAVKSKLHRLREKMKRLWFEKLVGVPPKEDELR